MRSFHGTPCLISTKNRANAELVVSWVGFVVGSPPHPVTVTARMITFLEGNLYKPSFATVTGCFHAFRWGMSLPTPTPEHREAPGTKAKD